MIFISPQTGNYTYQIEPDCDMGNQSMMVDVASHTRITDLLGPDGQPLMVGYERPAVGFDLRSNTESARIVKASSRRHSAALKRLASK